MVGEGPARLHFCCHVHEKQRVAAAGSHGGPDVVEAGSVTDSLTEEIGRGTWGERK